MTLPPATLYRGDLLLEGFQIQPSAAVVMMQGNSSDALQDFEQTMTVLQHGAAAHYDAASFVNACVNNIERMDTRSQKVLC